jgi:hypothetical protein
VTNLDILGNANASKVLIEGTSSVSSLNANGNVFINVAGGNIPPLNINSGAGGSNLQLGDSAIINNFYASGSVTVKGYGRIISANVNINSVSFERRPDTFVLATGVTTTIAGVETTTSTPTVVGSLAINLSSAIAGTTKNINLTYVPGEALNGGTVVFNLPIGFSANVGDIVKIGAGNASALTATQVGNGQNVKINGVYLSPITTSTTVNGVVTYVNTYQPITLTLVNKVIPGVNTYTFSGTSDVDGSGTRPATPGTGNEQKTFTTSRDITPPIVTAGIQSVTDAPGQTVNVSSSDNSGKVYIILTGVPQSTVAELDAAVSASPRSKGASGAVIASGTNILLSTEGLAVGEYYAYAVDAAGNISSQGTNLITISPVDITIPVVTAAIQSVTNGPGQTANVSSSEGTGKIYIILLI